MTPAEKLSDFTGPALCLVGLVEFAGGLLDVFISPKGADFGAEDVKLMPLVGALRLALAALLFIAVFFPSSDQFDLATVATVACVYECLVLPVGSLRAGGRFRARTSLALFLGLAVAAAMWCDALADGAQPLDAALASPWLMASTLALLVGGGACLLARLTAPVSSRAVAPEAGMSYSSPYVSMEHHKLSPVAKRLLS